MIKTRLRGLGWLLLAVTGIEMSAVEPCRIEVYERGTDWPVPLIELQTTHHARFVTDNAGIIAFDLPELMERETWFDVIGHGYDVPKDGFGMRGVRLVPEPGKTIRVEVDRQNIARRLGRLTGGGLFGESQRFGEHLNAFESGIVGCDSIQNAVHNGRMFWAWGDTTITRYPLGIFAMTSATTPIQPLKRFKPPIEIPFDYFTDEKGHPRGVAQMPGSGPTWISGYMSLPDQSGRQRLVCYYVKIKPPLEAYQAGLAVWNEDKETFEQLKVIWNKSDETPDLPIKAQGHPAFWKDEHGKEWVLLGDPLPTVKIPATFEAWQDYANWESIDAPEFLHDTQGNKVKTHSGSIAWNEHRGRWITVFMQHFGNPTPFGELWYAEAKSPLGPWGPAVKVLTHESYTFYNPRLHPEFTNAEDDFIVFEGTYTKQFVKNDHPTPRYDYNQILYRLDLDDPHLAPARGH